MTHLRKVVALSPAALAALDTFTKATPVPSDHAIVLKLPAAIICCGIAWFATGPRAKRSALIFMILGAVVLAAYMFFTLSSLHSDRRYYRPGDNSVIGLWLTDQVRQVMRDEHTSERSLRDNYGPANWDQLYSQESQLSRCAVMSLLYCSAFASFTFALRKL